MLDSFDLAEAPAHGVACTNRPIGAGRTALFDAKAVADARLGRQMSRARGVFLELLPQLPHVHPQIGRFLGVSRPPDREEDLLVGEDLARVSHQCSEELVLS